MSAWICTRDCYDAEGRLVPGWDGTPSKPRTIVYGDFHELVQRNPGCFVRATGKGSGARMRGLDCIRAKRRTVDGVEFASGSALSLESIYEDRELFDRLRALTIRLKEEGAPSDSDKAVTPAHLAAGLEYNQVHSLAHIEALEDLAKQHPEIPSFAFNVEHALHHGREAKDHADRWIADQASKDKTFKSAFTKVTTQAAGPLIAPAKPDQSKSDDLLPRRLRIRSEPERPFSFRSAFGDRSVKLWRSVLEEFTEQARHHAYELGVEWGATGFRRVESVGVDVSGWEVPGPNSRCYPRAFALDYEAAFTTAESRLADGWEWCARMHSHLEWEGDRSRLWLPSGYEDDDERGDAGSWGDVAGMRGIRRDLGLTYFVELIAIVPRDRSRQVEFVAWVCRDWLDGAGDRVEPARIVGSHG